MSRGKRRRRAQAGLAAVLLALATVFVASAASAAAAPTHRALPSTTGATVGPAHRPRPPGRPHPARRGTVRRRAGPIRPRTRSSATTDAPALGLTRRSCRRSRRRPAATAGPSPARAPPARARPPRHPLPAWAAWAAWTSRPPAAQWARPAGQPQARAPDDPPPDLVRPQGPPPARGRRRHRSAHSARRRPAGRQATRCRPPSTPAQSVPAAANPAQSWPLTDTAVLIVLLIALTLAIGGIVLIAGYRGRSH